MNLNINFAGNACKQKALSNAHKENKQKTLSFKGESWPDRGIYKINDIEQITRCVRIGGPAEALQATENVIRSPYLVKVANRAQEYIEGEEKAKKTAKEILPDIKALSAMFKQIEATIENS